MNSLNQALSMLTQPTLETLYMVILSTVFALILGFPLGVVLTLTAPEGLKPNALLYRILDGYVNIFRSFPFIILMILLFPLSRLIVGTTIGTTASIVPLAVGAAPFVGRIVEGCLKEVDPGVIEAVTAMGAGTKDIVFKVLIPEALPALTTGATLTVINIIGYSAMAGAIGGGGLGDLAIRYGFYRFNTPIMVLAVTVIVILVQGTQILGNQATRKLRDRIS